MSIITISRQYGSGGDEIAEIVSSVTGYRLFDKHILTKAAFDSGLSEQEIVDFSEDHYKAQGFFDRLFGRSRPIAQVRTWKEDKGGVRMTEEMQLTEEQALGFVRKAIEMAYRMDHIIIVGRGGQVILKDRPDVLHVRVQAPFEDRLIRVRSYPDLVNRFYGDSVESRRAAQDLIEKSDEASIDYLKRFHNVDWADAMLYHMIINTGKLPLEQAARLIIETARQMDRVPEPA